jgi:hypothetical protein
MMSSFFAHLIPSGHQQVFLFFSQFCKASGLAIFPQEDLAKFGHRSERKVEHLQKFSILKKMLIKHGYIYIYIYIYIYSNCVM